MIASSLQEFCSYLRLNSAIISIDIGDKKLGFAISDMSRVISMPLEVIRFEQEKHKIAHIIQLIDKHKICGIILGLPLNMDGTESDQTIKVQAFATKLSEKIVLPIFMQDERMTSLAANALLRAAGMNRKERHQMDDQVAACLILESVINRIKNSI